MNIISTITIEFCTHIICDYEQYIELLIRLVLSTRERCKSYKKQKYFSSHQIHFHNVLVIINFCKFVLKLYFHRLKLLLISLIFI